MKFTSLGYIASLCHLTLLTSLIPVFLLAMAMGVASEQDIRHYRNNYNDYNYNHYNRPPAKHPYQTELSYEDSTQVLHPEFVNTRTNVTVRVGEVAVLPCAVRNLGTKQVVWRRLCKKEEPKILTVGDFVWNRKDDIKLDYKLDQGFVSHWDLRVSNVQADDAGTYECQVTDKPAILWHVHLQVKPKRILNPTVVMTGPEFVDSGETIRLVCNATGGEHIPEDIDWFKDGTKINMREDKPGLELNKKMSLKTGSLISELTIAQAQIEDNGNYICRSSDREIDDLKVTVLIAPDSSNVKRGTGSLTDTEDTGRGSSSSMTSSSFVIVTSLFIVVFLRLPQKCFVFS